MNVPAIWLLIPFIVFFLGLVITALAHLILVWRFGEHSSPASVSSGLFLIGIAAIVFATFTLLRDIDWHQAYQLTLPSFGITAPKQSF